MLRLTVRQVEAQRIKTQISQMVEEEMGRNRREYYLRQRCGPSGTSWARREEDDLETLRQRIEQLSDEALAAARKQLARLKLMRPARPSTLSPAPT